MCARVAVPDARVQSDDDDNDDDDYDDNDDEDDDDEDDDGDGDGGTAFRRFNGGMCPKRTRGKE